MACYAEVNLHAGVSNDFLINTRNETALVYNDVSVNENMHLATAFKILRRPGNDLWEHLSPDQYRFFRRTVIQIVLATDMAGHSELLQVSILSSFFYFKPLYFTPSLMSQSSPASSVVEADPVLLVA